MNNTTLTIENSLVSYANSLYAMSNEATDIVKLYFATTASTLVGALATDTTPATVTSALSKGQLINGITLLQQLQNFFGNAAVSSGDYMGTAQNLVNGDYPANATLSPDVENIGNRLKVVGQNAIQLSKDGALLVKTYNASGLSAIIGSISGSTIVFGCNLSQAKFVSGVVLVEQFLALMNKDSVSTGDYLTTVVNFVQGS